jgi:hypothetical protein
MYCKTPLAVCFAALLLTSCSKVYSPALYHQDIAYQPKPASFDTAKTATYFSGGINFYSNPNLADLVVSTQFNVSRGYVFDHFNLAYGAFGVLGDYQNGAINSGEPNYFTDKFFSAIGGRASVNAYVNSGRVDFRYIGMEVAYSHEFGDYANFRNAINGQPDFYADTRTDLFTIGLTTEVIFHNIDNVGFQHGIRGFLGTTLGHNPLDDTFYAGETPSDRLFRNIFPKVSYFIKFKHYFATFEVGSNIFARFGFKF